MNKYTVDEAKERIKKYLSEENPFAPLVVNLESANDYNCIKEYSEVMMDCVRSSEYCDKFGFQWADLQQTMTCCDNPILVTELSGYLKFFGMVNEVGKLLYVIPSQPVVVLLRNCQDYFKVSVNSKQGHNLIMVQNDFVLDEEPKIMLYPANYDTEGKGKFYRLKEIGKVLDEETFKKQDELAVLSEISYTTLSKMSDFNVYDCQHPYTICKKYTMEVLKDIEESLGTEDNWQYLSGQLAKYQNFNDVVNKVIGDCRYLSNCFKRVSELDRNEKWLFFLGLKVYGSGGNVYLQKVLSKADNYDSFVDGLYNELLEYVEDDRDFGKLYDERKRILQELQPDLSRMHVYCKMARNHPEKAISYLTDLTELERENIVELLDRYKSIYFGKDLSDLLGKVYPDLMAYLEEYSFGKEFIDGYIQDYKKLKVLNMLTPEFLDKVEQQAEKREFNSLLPRSAIVDRMPKKDTYVYFVDAMGIEYVNFIVAKCNQKGFNVNTEVARCELPSLTNYNKEFVEIFQEAGCVVKDVKDLDKIKHSGTESFNYEKTKLPIHVIEELRVISGILDDAQARLNKGDCSRVVLVSDHGASRLAVVHDNGIRHEMADAGRHGGRCCLMSETDVYLTSATQGNDYWVLANYDLFKGGRRASVEVHGGASIEETVIPIITITKKDSNLVVKLDTKELTYNPRKPDMQLKIFVSKAERVEVKINNKIYSAKREHDDFYVANLNDITKANDYDVKVLVDGNEMLTDIVKVKSAGITIRKLF